jgi:hypothetical protein
MSLIDPYAQSQNVLSRRAAARYAALSAISERKGPANSDGPSQHVSPWRRVRTLLVKPA